MTGATSRTNVRQKHFDDVLSMVANWFPSQATLYRIKQLETKIEKRSVKGVIVMPEHIQQMLFDFALERGYIEKLLK